VSRGLQYANLAGVLALAILCVVQWRRDRDLNLEVNRLEKTRIAGESKIQEQEKTLLGLTSDLALFKEQLTTARSDLRQARDRLRTVESENFQLTGERDQLREAITNWMSAVAIRDERINEANGRIRDLADQLNASIRKFNELTTNFNNVVTELNKQRADSGAAAK